MEKKVVILASQKHAFVCFCTVKTILIWCNERPYIFHSQNFALLYGDIYRGQGDIYDLQSYSR